MNWKGTYTAIVTPFNDDGSLDETSLRKLVDEQIDGGVTGIVPCGTTGESPTLSDAEMKQVMTIVIDQVKGRCKVIGGAGSNKVSLIDFDGNVRSDVLDGLARSTPSEGPFEPNLES